MKRLSLLRGRLLVYVEPRDIWVGAYVAEDYVYVCPLPLVVFRWERSESWGQEDFCPDCGGPCRDESDYDGEESEVPQ